MMPGSTDITITVKVGDNRDLIMATVEMLSKELNRNL
jgi:hypothetical protein